MSDNNTSDSQNVTKAGDKYKATVTRHFDSMEQATSWGDSQTVKDIPEKPASETSIREAEEINSNVVPAPMPAGAHQDISGGGQDVDDDNNDKKQYHAPHETGDTAANDSSEIGDTGEQESKNKKK